MSRLSQMLDNEAKRRGRSQRDIAQEFGWSQQTFNTWLNGSIPRQQFFAKIGEFLTINLDDLEMLISEARTSTGSTKLPKAQPAILGKVTDRKDGKFHFATVPFTRYAFRVDTKIMGLSGLKGGFCILTPLFGSLAPSLVRPIRGVDTQLGADRSNGRFHSPSALASSIRSFGK